jgi:hypothetical protein
VRFSRLKFSVVYYVGWRINYENIDGISNIKTKGKFVPMKNHVAYRGSTFIAPRILRLENCSASLSDRFNHGKICRCWIEKETVGQQSPYGRFTEEINLLPLSGIEPQTLRHITVLTIQSRIIFRFYERGRI